MWDDAEERGECVEAASNYIVHFPLMSQTAHPDNVHAFGPIDGESQKSQKALERCTMYKIFILYR